MSDPTHKQLSRRDALKLLGAAAGASVLTNLPSKWSTPQLTAGVLPAHAQSSVMVVPGPCEDRSLIISAAGGLTLGPHTEWDASGPGSYYWDCSRECVYVYVEGGPFTLDVTIKGTYTFQRAVADTYWIYVHTPSGQWTEGTSAPIIPPAGSGCASFGLPTVTTDSYTRGPGLLQAQFQGTVTSDGGAPVTSYGFYWAAHNNPTSADNSEFGIGLPAFTTVITVSPDPGTPFSGYFRAWAENALGIALGAVRPFITAYTPTVVTDAVTGTTPGQKQATLNGHVTDDGGSPLTDTGFYWARHEDYPPLDSGDNPTPLGLTATPFSKTVTTNPASAPDDFGVVAWASNSLGTGVGAVVNFQTDLCLAEGTLITLADGTSKKIEDIQHSDWLRVWNFDQGRFDAAQPLWVMKAGVSQRYNLLEFSDGSTLKTIKDHRIFNKEQGMFTYEPELTPMGTTTFNVNGEDVTLMRKTVVHEQVKYYNVITDRHINLFANGILTSCRYNNLYPIVDMHFVKEDRTPVPQEVYGVEDKYYEGLRLAEQVIPVEDTIAYVARLEARQVQPQLVMGWLPREVDAELVAS